MSQSDGQVDAMNENEHTVFPQVPEFGPILSMHATWQRRAVRSQASCKNNIVHHTCKITFISRWNSFSPCSPEVSNF